MLGQQLDCCHFLEQEEEVEVDSGQHILDLKRAKAEIIPETQ
jgi:hypothetical protein